MSAAIEIVRAGPADLEAVVRLFDQYRVFYGRPSELEGARSFIAARLAAGDSVVFLARAPGARDGLGFTQLYPSYSSVAMRRIWILNDLYVAPAARRQGVGQMLMDRARAHGQETGALRLELSTAKTNATAQALYRRLGYVADDVFLRFALKVDGEG